MKKSLSFLLILSMVFGLALAGCGGSGNGGSKDEPKEDLSAYEYGEIDYKADMEGIDLSLTEKTISEIDRETLEQAIQEQCFAYYWKNPYTQYDLGTLSYDMNTSYRRTTYMTADEIAADEQWYSQCAEYGFMTYWNLCNYEFFGDRIKVSVSKINVDDAAKPINNEKVGWDEATVTEFLRHEARPGDIYCGGGKSITSHMIMIVGDKDGDGVNECLHCWPYKGGTLNEKKMDSEDLKRNDQKWEPEGSIVYQSVDELLLSQSGNPNWYVFGEKNDDYWRIFRPFEQADIQDKHLTTDAVTRLKYSDIQITKTLNNPVQYSIGKGAEVVVTEEIKNNSKNEYTDLSVVEYVPDYAELVSQDANCTVDGRKLKWKLNIPAGESVVVSYTIKNHLSGGNTLHMPKGLVGGIYTRGIDLQVQKTVFNEEQMAVIDTYRTKKTLPEGVDLTSFSELAYVKEFYKQALGIEVEMPDTVNEFLSAVFEEKKAIPGCMLDKMLFLKETPDAKLFGMIPTNKIGGYCYSTGVYGKDDGNGNIVADPEWRMDRICDIKETDFMPGDVIVCFGGNSRRSLDSENDLEIYIYLGEGQVVAKVGKIAGVGKFDGTVANLLNKNVLFYLRPTLNN